jgi:ubiquinone/menaquinone biosynthesis C-methylase UbiE
VSDTGGNLRCERCEKDYPRRADWIDFLPDAREESQSVGAALMHLPAFAKVYERYWRPTFVRIAGGQGRPSFDEEFQWVMQALRPAQGGTVIDLSCGPGLFGRRLASSGLFGRVWGVDHSQAMLHQCVSAGSDAAQALELIRADAAYLPFSDGVIAGIHAGAALHLWPRPNEGLSEVARVLRPGGVFVASTFVRPESRATQVLADWFQRTSRARVFAESSLKNACEGLGLTEFKPTRRGAFILFSVVKR